MKEIHKEIAEVIKKHSFECESLFGDIAIKGEEFIDDLAERFEKEDKNRTKTNNKELWCFDKTQFLKDCGGKE